VQAKERPVDSLLQEHVDFQLATKLPPTISQERTEGVEKVVKQRVLDELFDDPVRKALPKAKREQDDNLDYSRSKKGLGEIYEEDY